MYVRNVSRLRLKCDGTRAETRFHLSAKRTSPFKSSGASVQSTAGGRGVRSSDSNAGCTMFRGSVMGTAYPFHPPVSPSLPLLCVTVCHRVSTGLLITCETRRFYKPVTIIAVMECTSCRSKESGLTNFHPFRIVLVEFAGHAVCSRLTWRRSHAVWRGPDINSHVNGCCRSSNWSGRTGRVGMRGDGMYPET
jgi:hypothetical protein